MTELTEEAKYDIIGIMADYARDNKILAVRFKETVVNKINIINNNPLLYQKVYKSYRRVLLGKFPYSIFYTTDGKTSLIHAIIHQKISINRLKKLLN